MNKRPLPPSAPPTAERTDPSPAVRPPLSGEELSWLDMLQEPMERLALGQEANSGRFCGRCYARLTEPRRRKASLLPASICAVCGVSTDAVPPVNAVPPAVLALYLAKRRREGLIVNLFAFLGIFLSLVLSALLWFLLPGGWWEVLPFAMLAFGSYYLARLLGFGPGVALGGRSGRALRNRRWQASLERRGPSTPRTATDEKSHS